MCVRTDMAVELVKDAGNIDGIKNEFSENESGIEISRINVFSKSAAEKLGKPIGNYITMDMGNIASLLPEERRLLSDTCAKEVSKLIGDKKSVLIVGLGNRMITPDSLGPKCSDKIFVTRHIKEYIPEAIDERSASVAAIAPGVLGMTGIESEEVILSLLEKLNAEALVAIDSLAAREIRRIGASIQITDTGIQPGAGVGNKRARITDRTVGVPVIAVGVPTVAYASTVARDYFFNAAELVSKECFKELESSLINLPSELIITPTDIDKLTDNAARVIADALNIAINPHVPYEDIRDFMD